MNALYHDIDSCQQRMIQGPGDGAEEWICESCIYYPPSSFGGKPCSYCWPDDPFMNCYLRREEYDVGDENA